MKTITALLLVFTVAVLTSCEGPVGPQGPPGEDGVNILGSVFEIDQVNFTADNNYSILYQFPSDFEIYDTDVVLVYILWETANNGNTDVWRLLPQTVVLDEGVLQYNFDYTTGDVQIFLEGTLPFDMLLPAETDNQVFRIAVLPADFAKNKSVDVTDMNSVLKSLDISPTTIQKKQIVK